jgi:hypothetical protein
MVIESGPATQIFDEKKKRWHAMIQRERKKKEEKTKKEN